jgi:hypothetical protein
MNEIGIHFFDLVDPTASHVSTGALLGCITAVGFSVIRRDAVLREVVQWSEPEGGKAPLN